MDMRKKNIILSIVVIMLGIMVAGGTFAYLTMSLTVKNGQYNGKVDCFSVDYSINNDDNTQDIIGTLFPTVGPSKGLFGKVSINMNSICETTGTGSLYVEVNNATSTKFGEVVREHCENSLTLETMKDYSNESDCVSNNGTWVSNGTALKYAVYNSSDITTNPLRVGYFGNNSIGSTLNLYDGFMVNDVQQNYYIYIWLDGYLSDNTYASLPFSGVVKAQVVQNHSS